MRYDWDPAKNEANIRKHGFDFNEVSQLFGGSVVVEWEDNREDYGEVRIVAIGLLHGWEATVVYTDRTIKGELVRWIIPARRSSRLERRVYRGQIEE